MKLSATFALAAISSVCVTRAGVAQGTPSGRRIVTVAVIDTTLERIPYANLQRVGGASRVVADDSGKYHFAIGTRDHFPIDIRRIGYRPATVEVQEGTDTTIYAQLTPIPRALSPVAVVSPMGYRSLDIHGFYARLTQHRSGLGWGYFITPEDLERSNAVFVSHLLDGYPGVNVRRGLYAKDDMILGGLSGVSGRRCLMIVYLDGIRVIGGGAAGSDAINELVNPTALAGIEIYPRAIEAPHQYQVPTNPCGVVLLWTK